MEEFTVKDRLATGESLRDIGIVLMEEGTPALGLVNKLQECPFSLEMINSWKNAIAQKLNQEYLGRLISPDSIQVLEARLNHVAAFYPPEKDLRTHFEIVELMIQDFYEWADFGKNAPKIPRFFAPSKNEDIVVSYNDNPTINFLRALNVMHDIRYQVNIDGVCQQRTAWKNIHVTGHVQYLGKYDSEKGGFILIPLDTPAGLLDVPAAESLHFFLGPITRKHLREERKKSRFSDVEFAPVIREWMAREEGLVHGATTPWLKKANDKYKADIDPRYFQSYERELLRQQTVPTSYRYIPMMIEKIQSLGLARVVDIYRENPQELFP